MSIEGAFALVLLSLYAGFAGAAPRDSRVPGGVAVIDLGASDTRPRVRFRDQPVLVERRQGQWLAYVGLPLDLDPGAHEIALDDTGGLRRVAFTVAPKRYPEQHVTIRDHGKVQLSPENEARAEREIAEIRRLKLAWRETDSVDLDFALPANGPLSGRFGARRIFNGEPRAPHVGLDVALPRGSVVRASAAGRVLAVGDYFFNGKTVFLDHGNGLITLLCHLDRIDVQPGAPVERGQPIGLSGMSGRASGPHLHWSVILNGAMVDPELFLEAKKVRKPEKRREAERATRTTR